MKKDKDFPISQILLWLMAHDIKSPLGLIRWHTEMLLQWDHGKVHEEQKKVLHMMTEEYDNMSHMIKQFMHIVSMHDSREIFHNTPVKISEICEEFSINMRADLKKKHQSIEYNLEQKDTVMADRTSLKLILHTLLHNAIKYGKEKDILTVRLDENRDTYTISVSNHGPEILPEEQSLIFSKNYRSPSSKGIDPFGSGMGLYLLRSFIEKTGWETWFTSDKNETTFFFRYPKTGMKFLTTI